LVSSEKKTTTAWIAIQKEISGGHDTDYSS